MDEIYVTDIKTLRASNQPSGCLQVRSLFQLIMYV